MVGIKSSSKPEICLPKTDNTTSCTSNIKLSCLFLISSKLCFKDCYVYTVSVERYLFLPMNSDLDLNFTPFSKGFNASIVPK